MKSTFIIPDNSILSISIDDHKKSIIGHRIKQTAIHKERESCNLLYSEIRNEESLNKCN